jgi:hypothetical protein
MVKDAKLEGYKEQGSMQLLPVDLRSLRTHLLSVPCLPNLRTWCTIIFATMLFLRYDEFHEVKGEHFLPELFSIPGLMQTIEHLAVHVFGKVDKQWIPLRLYADNEFPDLCPVRVLLIFLYLIDWKGGYIFPSDKELHNPPADGIYQTMVDYKNLTLATQEMVQKVCHRRKNMKVGCQTWRKTTYCVAIFGAADRDNLKMSARHSQKSKDAPTYSKDAEALYKDHLQTPHEQNRVKKWTNIKIDAAGNAEVMAALSGSLFVEMKDLPVFFVEKMLGIHENNPRRKDPRYLLEAAYKYVTSDGPEKRFRQIQNTLHPDTARELSDVMGDLVLHRVRAVLKQPQLALNALEVPPLSSNPNANQNANPNSKQTAPIENVLNDLPERKRLKSASGELTAQEKIEIMKEIEEKKTSWGKLTSGAKTFRSKFLTPAMNCLENHFDGDLQKFASKYPDFKHTLFPKQCCNGKGSSCSTD